MSAGERLNKAADEVVAALCALAEEEQYADQDLAERLWSIAHVLELAQGEVVAAGAEGGGPDPESVSVSEEA